MISSRIMWEVGNQSIISYFKAANLVLLGETVSLVNHNSSDYLLRCSNKTQSFEQSAD